MDDRHSKIIEILDENYGDIGSGLRFTTPFELLVATILSAQSTDVRVNMVTPALFAKYPTAFEMSQLSEETLAKEINSIGLYRNKSKSIIKASKMLVEKYDGEVPSDREKLQELPGVGRKTANVVLCNAFHIPAFAVDTHVFRVSQRLGFAKHKTVEGVEQQLMQTIPSELWCSAHHLVIWHGRKICKAQKPLCETCCVCDYCPSVDGYKKSK